MNSHPVSRRAFLRLAPALAIATRGTPAFAGDSDAAAVDRADEEIWRRFIDRRFDVLLHYAGLGGEVLLPTAAECLEAKPNGMGWSSPIEDGPFFGGLYLDGLCNRWRALGDEVTASRARRIAAGLMKLSDLGGIPAFVPRGIGGDGRSFYPASSEDQLFPWFYGLWKYSRTELPSPDERSRLGAKLRETVLALAEHDWRVPCVRPDYGYRGAFTRPDAHDAARLLFFLQAMRSLDENRRWEIEYRTRLDERVGKAMRSRREILADGLEFDAPGGGTSRVWTHSMSQAALRGLWEADEDEGNRQAFRSGLVAGAERAGPHLERARRYDRTNALAFDPDWRFLNASWKPQATCEDAIALGRVQLPLWAERNPRSPWEDDTMREPLFAAWMVRLANEEGLNLRYGRRIEEMLESYDWSNLRTASFFIAVNVHHETGRKAGFRG